MKYLIMMLLFLSACGPATTILQAIPGPQGPKGDPGAPGTVVTPIQLCAGFTPTYPSSFPEYAFCIGDKLYGVYSTNGGFMAELPPGNYRSDGVGASCVFTIEPHCVVTQ